MARMGSQRLVSPGSLEDRISSDSFEQAGDYPPIATSAILISLPGIS